MLKSNQKTKFFWFKKRGAKMNNINTVSTFRRAQLRIETSEGEGVSSTTLRFNKKDNEYLTTISLAHTFGFDEASFLIFLVEHQVSWHVLYGQKWVNVCDIIPLFGWTLTGEHGMIEPS
jgi:hypothetical protein